MSNRFIKISSPAPYLVMLTIAAAVLGTIWFLNTFERKEITIKQRMSPEARRNPLLAAQRLLTEVGHEVKSGQGKELLNDLPGTGDALVVRRIPALTSSRTLQNLFSWVEDGGHLLVVPSWQRSDHPGATDILDELGIKRVTRQVGTTAGENEEQVENRTIAPEKGDQDLPTMEAIIADTPLQVAFHTMDFLYDDSARATLRIPHSSSSFCDQPAEGAKGESEPTIPCNWLLQYPVGDGKITVLSDMTLFTNQFIGDHDHAALLEWLVRDNDTVWLVLANQSRSLPAIIFSTFPRTSLVCILVLILILWRLQQRGGTVIVSHQRHRPNIIHHIEAIGNFAWRTDRLENMLRANRQTLLSRLYSRFLGQRTSLNPNKDDYSTLIEKSKVKAETMTEALVSHFEHEHELIRISRAMQKINSRLRKKEMGNKE